MILFFDTETTGKYDFKAPPASPHQPHLVQLAAAVMTLEETVVASLNVLVRPEGWVIPEEAARIHGVTQELATIYGLSRRTVLAMFSNLCKVANCAVAYNIEFDSNVIWTQFEREQVRPESFNALRHVCAMKAATPVCKLPKPSNYRSVSDPYKWPNLTEAHQHFFQTGFEGAHNARVDVEALARVTFRLVKEGAVLLQCPKIA